ncbi:MAG: STAS domain-containing protein [Armatimonadetes bacterium]|nr:STAS domain-containing protein [Armatimonadota bacterium]
MASSPRALRLVRLPGEFGPILRCAGELSVASSEALRRELNLLVILGHPALTLNLSGCCFLDMEGILTILHTFKRLRQDGRRLVVVAGTERTARLLQVVGLTQILPVFPTEEAAAAALRCGRPSPSAPKSWAVARMETLARWCAIQEAIEEGPPAEVLRQITSMFTLCERAEEIFQERPTPTAYRCQFCPLFYALGGRSADIGCRSALDPVIEAVRVGNLASAQARVADLIGAIEEMPLPEEGPARPAPRPSTAGQAAGRTKL